MRVLITGATGLVGTEVRELLAQRSDVELVGTSRRGSEDSVAWDMAAGDPPEELRGEWHVVVNAAADVRWTQPAEDAERSNVATLAALEGLVTDSTHVVHVSTAYATGLRGDVESEDLADYRNTYEWSKAHAERVARELFPRLTVVRPPLVVGRRGDGRAARFAGMYVVLRGITSSTIPAIVAEEGAYFDLIPVDDLARLVADAVTGDADGGGVFTIAGGDRAPEVAHALDVISGALNGWRTERGLDPFDPPTVLNPASWNRFFLPFAREELAPRQLKILDLLRNFEPYMEITTPLEPTHRVTDVEPCIAASVRYWADQNERVASLPPRPWKGEGA